MCIEERRVERSDLWWMIDINIDRYNDEKCKKKKRIEIKLHSLEIGTHRTKVQFFGQNIINHTSKLRK